MSQLAGWARIAGAAAILAVLLVRLGSEPFLRGLRTVHAWPLLAAAVLTAATTVCSAARWVLIARGLGVRLPLRAAVVHYYRSQFLNSALPGGVLGDVHRGLRQGREAGDVAVGLRAVAWDRVAGQAVQAVLAVLVLLGIASPVRSVAPLIAGLGIAVLLAAAVALAWLPRRGPSRLARTVRAVRSDLRRGLLNRAGGPLILLLSALVVAGHATIFLIAARTAGTPGPLADLLPLAVLVLLSMAVPLSVGGWGPREGVAAWAFGVAGFGMSQGVTTATVYGVMAFVATLPGGALLAAGWLRRTSGRRAWRHQPAGRLPSREPVGVGSVPARRDPARHDPGRWEPEPIGCGVHG